MSHPKSLLPEETAGATPVDPPELDEPDLDAWRAQMAAEGISPLPAHRQADIERRFAERRAAREAQWAAEDAAQAAEDAEFEAEFGADLAELRAEGMLDEPA